MNNYKNRYDTVETEWYTSNESKISTITDFKNLVIDETELLHKSKARFAKESNTSIEDIPAPLLIFVLLADYSYTRTILFPKSELEKTIMILAVKKEILIRKQSDVLQTPLYAALVVEAFVGKIDCSEDEAKGLTGKEITKKAIQDWKSKSNEEKDTRVIIQFESNNIIDNNLKYDYKVYSIIDPGILHLLDEESESITEGSNKGDSEGLMASLLNYTKEEEMNSLGSDKSNLEVQHFDLLTAIEFIKESLKN